MLQFRVALIAFQCLVLLLLVTGLGYWIWRLLSLNTLFGRYSSWFVAAVAGLAAGIALLQNLVYFDLRIRYSAWLAGALALAGVGLLVRSRWQLWHFAPDPRAVKSIALTCALFALIFLFQGAPLLYHGPHNYYGRARTDQVNYVSVAQFLIDEPFSTNYSATAFHPWLIKAIQFKDMRIGQSVLNACLAVLSGTDAKGAYGFLSVFYIAVLGVAGYVLMRMWSVGWPIAFLGGFWLGVLPSLTNLHLNGFFSQCSAMFAFPALVVAVWSARTLDWRVALITGLILNYIAACYTEVFGLAMALSLVLLAIRADMTRTRRLWTGLEIGALTLVLDLPFLWRAILFLRNQYKVAVASARPGHLFDLFDSQFPNGGSMRGWGEAFFGYGLLPNWHHFDLPVIFGAMLLVLCAAALFSRSGRKRAMLSGCVAVPALALTLILAREPFMKYSFQKVLESFDWLWCCLSVLGLMRLLRASRLGRGARQTLAVAAVALLAFLSLAGSVLPLKEVIDDKATLADIDSTKLREAYRYVESHPEERYVIHDNHSIEAAWYAYHARKAEVYFDSQMLSDFPIRPLPFALPPIPYATFRGMVLARYGMISALTEDAPPEISVDNPQGEDLAQDRVWYWVGDSASLDVTRYGPQTRAGQFDLTFLATAGPANPNPTRRLELTGPGASQQEFTFSGSQKIVYPLTCKPGDNHVIMKILDPLQQTIFLPGDSRKHMLRVDDVEVTLAPAASK